MSGKGNKGSQKEVGMGEVDVDAGFMYYVK